MIHLVCYDIATAEPADARRLRAVAKLLERYGVRVQKSVFEVVLGEETFRHIRAALLDTIDTKRDSLLIYCIDGAKRTTMETHGALARNDMFANMII